jgi:mono/diheme cytochrome c family protein
MSKRPPVLLAVVTTGFAWLSGVSATDAAPVDFAQEVAPIFEAHCVRCHNATERKGKFSLATAEEFFMKRKGHEAVLVAGAADDSLLVELITPPHPGAEPDMPEEGEPLTAEQVAVIRRWIAEGARWPEGVVVRAKPKADKKTWWSLQPLRNFAPPEVPGAPEAWQREPIDRFIHAGLAAKGLSPSPPASPREFIRRATFDLTGLPPTPEEVERFVSELSAENAPASVQATQGEQQEKAYERLIDRLLASPRYGERWGRHWLDVVRFGESTGFERNIIRDDAWPFRDYVIASLNDDKPFDRFIMEHLAGDQLAPGDLQVEIGTAFLVAGPYDDVGNQDAKAAAQIRANTLDDIVGATSAAFLGLTVSCARCHDHKFDPVEQADYYRLQAAFAGIQQGSRTWASAADRAADEERRAPLIKERAEAKRELEEIEKAGRERLRSRREELIAKLSEPKPEKLEEALLAAVLTPEESERRTALTQRRVALQSALDKIPKLPTAWLGTLEQPKASAYLMLGGDPQKRGPEIAPASLNVLAETTKPFALAADAPEGARRLELARWMVADDNPLTPRVLANRVWHYHFGTGILDSPSDFGYMGGRPTHPELLDYLAQRLKHHGWRLKPLHREIMLSQTYRQSAQWRKEAADVDFAARLLWRFPPRRLSAEELRDTMLAVSGKLNLTAGGPGFRLYRYLNDNVSTYVPLEQLGPETYRRAVYHQNARASTIDLLSDFDAPDCAASAPRRTATTTPLQALTLFNHSFTLDLARHFAERLRTECGADDVAAQVRRAFASISGDELSAEKQAAAEKLIATHGLPAFCRALLNSNELLHVR